MCIRDRIKGKLYKEESAGNWEPMETTAINDAGVAYRSIQRLLLSINDIEIKKDTRQVEG